MADDVLLGKTSTIERCVERVHEEYGGDPENLFENITRQDAIILNIQRATQAAIDLAMHLTRIHRLGVPEESREATERRDAIEGGREAVGFDMKESMKAEREAEVASPGKRRTRADIEPLLRELRTALEDLYGDRLEKLILYGSFARGDAWEGSDIDVMIVLHGEVDAWDEIKRTTNATYPLQLEHEELIALLPASLEAYTKRRSPLMMNVRNEGVLI